MALATDVGRIVEREFWVYRRLWRSSLFTSIVSPLLFLLGIGVGLGGVIDERTSSVDGMSYLAFVAPGLLAASAMQMAGMNSLWPVMAGTTWSRFFHGIVATPVSAPGLFGGYVGWLGIRAAQQAIVFLACAALLGGVSSWWAVLAVPAAVLTALAFASVLAAYAATQQMDLTFPLVYRLGMMPLFMFSETFFPLEQLPEWLRPVAWISPLWHGVELCRAATTGTVPSWGRMLVHVVVLLGVVAAGWAWGTRTFTRRLTS